MEKRGHVNSPTRLGFSTAWTLVGVERLLAEGCVCGRLGGQQVNIIQAVATNLDVKDARWQ